MGGRGTKNTSCYGHVTIGHVTIRFIGKSAGFCDLIVFLCLSVNLALFMASKVYVNDGKCVHSTCSLVYAIVCLIQPGRYCEFLVQLVDKSCGRMQE